MNNDILNMMRYALPELKARGNYNTWVVICPFHTDKRRPDLPQLCIDIKNQNYVCLGCGEKGNLDKMERELDKLKKA